MSQRIEQSNELHQSVSSSSIEVGATSNLYSDKLASLIDEKASMPVFADFFVQESVVDKFEDILISCIKNHCARFSKDDMVFLLKVKQDFPALPWKSIITGFKLHGAVNPDFPRSDFFLEIFRESLVEKLLNPNISNASLDWLIKVIYVSRNVTDLRLIILHEYLRADRLLFESEAKNHIFVFCSSRGIDEICKYDAKNQTKLLVNLSCIASSEFIDAIKQQWASLYYDKLNINYFDAEGLNLCGADLDHSNVEKVKNLDKAIFLSNDEFNDLACLERRIIRLHQNQYPNDFQLFSSSVLENILRYARAESIERDNHTHAFAVLKTALPLFGERIKPLGQTAGQAVNAVGGFFSRMVNGDNDIPIVMAPTSRQRKILALMHEIKASLLNPQQGNSPAHSKS